MIKNILNRFVRVFNNIKNKGDEGNNKKKIENLVFFIVILIITIIAINMVLKESNTKKNNTDELDQRKVLATIDDVEITRITDENNLNKELEDILSRIDGAGNVKVLITYSQTSKILPVFNEDNSKSDTEENDSTGGTRRVSQTSNKKEAIYQEINGEKVLVTQSTMMPSIEGAVILAEGAGEVNVRLKITQAVEAATGLPTHKIQVFKMKT